MIELTKEWGKAAVAFFLSFAITAGIYAPKEECEESVTDVTTTAGP